MLSGADATLYFILMCKDAQWWLLDGLKMGEGSIGSWDKSNKGREIWRRMKKPGRKDVW